MLIFCGVCQELELPPYAAVITVVPSSEISEIWPSVCQEGAEDFCAGDPERRAEVLRRRDGVPLAEGVWEKLKPVALRVGVVLTSGASQTAIPHPAF